MKKNLKSFLAALFLSVSVTAFLSASPRALSETVTVTEDKNGLFLGNPSGADTALSSRNNFLMVKPQYVLSYNSEKGIPNWVMWHLSVSDIGETGRSDDFRSDSELPEGFSRIEKSDYKFTTYGFDRGHMCPSADRSAVKEDNSVTFLMTNMVPQAPDLNRNVWKELESYTRRLAESGKELYIISGPCGKGGTTSKGTFEKIEKSSGSYIEVPSDCWKIILVLPEGENDLSRINAGTEVISVFMPNVQGIQKTGTWNHFTVSVDFIEEKTGYDFFSSLPDDVESVIESRVFQLSE